MNSLTTDFLNIDFPNPLILPSGIIQEIQDHHRAAEQGIGGITLKSITALPREGNPLPRVTMYSHGFLNSVGLRNPGIDKAVPLVEEFMKQSKVPVIVSIFATSIPDFMMMVEKLLPIKPTIIELNLSCPNTVDEMGEPLGMGASSTAAAVKGSRKIAGNSVKLVAKLSPNVPNIGDIAKAAEAEGADAISAINTVGPGMVININTKKPVLGNKEGGVSGVGIKPVAIRCVYDIYRSVKIPILGMGGISSWQDAVEIMMAGATLVGVGSAVYTNKNVYTEITEGLIAYMKKGKLDSLKSIVGAAHE